MKILGESFAGLAASAVRAVELFYPEEKRLFDDPFSLKFLPSCYQILVRVMYLPGLRERVLALREKNTPGVLGAILCRTRYFDDLVQKEVNGGLEQLVISGSGFDSRPYRIAGMEKVRVFEADLPGSVRLKQKRIKRVLGKTPENVSYVPVDFEKENLGDKLKAAGFQNNKKTLFLWEGVTQYISAEAVDRMLALIRNSGAKSSVLFTYVDRGVIDGARAPAWFERFKRMSKKIGAEWMFGIEPENIKAFLTRRGFALTSDAGAKDFRELYLKPLGRKLSIFDVERTAYARVKSR